MPARAGCKLPYLGGGYEIATMLGGEFQKVDMVTCLLQEFDGCDVKPRLILRPQYVGQKLYLRSSRFDGYDQVNLVLPPHVNKDPAGEALPMLWDFDAECICTLTLLRADGVGQTCRRADWSGATRISRRNGAIIVEHSQPVLDDKSCRNALRAWRGG